VLCHNWCVPPSWVVCWSHETEPHLKFLQENSIYCYIINLITFNFRRGQNSRHLYYSDPIWIFLRYREIRAVVKSLRNRYILCVPIYVSTALVNLGRFFSFLIHTHSVGLLGRGISPSQSRYLHTEQHNHKINANSHPWLKWDSNPWSQCSKGQKRFMP
jgi:hypothetical protein